MVPTQFVNIARQLNPRHFHIDRTSDKKVCSKIIDVLEQQGRSAGHPDAIISSTLSQRISSDHL
ncbi:hypothetical protein KIN20_002834 [Parelaphostrongylus tenuis]|uniref:Uncharacterized protein n=1 Tax=Parelaphostrongylus tenuis TaxID=148309 RepID=A0AAD5LVT5_PARTN|nr:hypothetical protein KIN20_002834 [Parelaphostrongylus tenuis]